MDVKEKISHLSPEQRAQLALRLAKTKRPGSVQKAATLPEAHPDPGKRYEPFPLSDIQQAYLIGRSEGMELGNTGCHVYFEVDLVDWNRSLFEAALQKVIQRHEMLRGIILPEGRQQILEHVPPYQIECQDLRGKDPSVAGVDLGAVRRKMSAYVHQTDVWPLFEFRASLVDAHRTRLHIGMDLLIADGRSFEIIFDELNRLYRNPDLILPPLELSFRDYLLAFNTIEETDVFRQSREYWRKRVPALPPSPELPLAKNPASLTQPEFKRHRARIDAATWRMLKDKSARNKLTPAGVLLSAYAEVLAIWSKTPRFTLNLTLFNRVPLHEQANDIVGDFTSVNLLEVDNSKAEDFAVRARRQQEQLWQDLDHRYFSGVQVMRELTRLQGVGPKAIMPVVFTSLLNLGGDSEAGTWAGRLGETVYSASQTPQVYLDLVAHEDRGALVVDWFALDDLFPPNFLDDLFEAYRSLLEDLALVESSWSHTLAENTRKLLPETQKQLLEEINNTRAPLSHDLLHNLFIQQVHECPNHIAVCSQDNRMSYAELFSRACRVEQELLSRGLEPNQFVGVVMEKGWEQVVAVMGISFAGSAYMPIDPALPPERQRYLIENGDVKVVLTQSWALERVHVPDGVEILTVDLMKPTDGAVPVLRTRQKPEDLAYVIYTSGSTGQPKGVIIDHRGAVNTVLDINQRFGVGPQDRVLALSRLNFDLSVYDIFGLLAAGGTIVMPSPELAQDTTHWAQLVVSEKITLWNTVPALMGLLVEQAEHGEPIGQSLRVIMMSGDWIPVSLPSQIRKLLPNADIMSLGGATEASIWSILYRIKDVDQSWKSIPYGKPMLNQTFHVLSPVQAPCPVWVPGQLHIGGIGLAKGYWRDAKKTSGSFIHHQATGQRMYRTGDWGRYLPDGNIEFLGREDSQVKVQGYRIELGEIEAKLQEHEAIDNCIVVVREDIPGEKRLVGYVIAKPGASLQIPALREFLRAKLPEYMVPAAFMFLDQFPLTANGKVDRKALPAAGPTPEMDCRKTAPRDMLELQLTRLWEKILSRHPIGLQDNFFDLGGHSLMAVRLFSELRKLTGQRLALSTLFQAPTVEKLAALLRTDGLAPNWSVLVPIQPGGSKPPFYCVHGAGGNVLLYHELARLLGPDYPFFGVQSYGMDNGKNRLQTVEEMAEHYLKEIRKLQPDGPYYLGGFCMGGQVAYEMAQKLIKAGERVALLVMIDTYNFGGVPLRLSFAEEVTYIQEKIRFYFRNFMRLSIREEFTYLAERLRGTCSRMFKKLQVTVSNLFNAQGASSADAADHDPGHATVFRINQEASFAYVADPYPGRVTIFKPQRNYTYASDEKMGWGGCIADLELVGLPVDPGAIFVEPFVQILADGLRAWIDEAADSEERSAIAEDSSTLAQSVLV